MYFCTYLNLCFCHVFLTNKAFVTFQEFKNNQECKPKTNFHYHNFWWMIKFVFCYVLKSEIYVIHKKRSSILREKRIRNPPISSIQVWEMLQKHIHVPKRDLCPKCEFASKQWNTKWAQSVCIFASKQWNVRKWN